jgi:hypothetical protein
VSLLDVSQSLSLVSWSDKLLLKINARANKTAFLRDRQRDKQTDRQTDGVEYSYSRTLSSFTQTLLNIKNVLIHVQEQQRLEKIFQCANTLYIVVIVNICPVLAPYLLLYVYLYTLFSCLRIHNCVKIIEYMQTLGSVFVLLTSKVGAGEFFQQ